LFYCRINEEPAGDVSCTVRLFEPPRS